MIRVLIVEDDPMVADLAAMYLEGIEGFCLEGRGQLWRGRAGTAARWGD